MDLCPQRLISGEVSNGLILQLGQPLQGRHFMNSSHKAGLADCEVRYHGRNYIIKKWQLGHQPLRQRDRKDDGAT